MLCSGRKGAGVDERWLLQVARALADPTRYRMLHEIRCAGEITCGELQAHFPLSQATISHHLKTLQRAGLVRVRAEGLFRHVSAEPERLAAFASGVVSQLGAPAAAHPRKRKRVRRKQRTSRER